MLHLYFILCAPELDGWDRPSAPSFLLFLYQYQFRFLTEIKPQLKIHSMSTNKYLEKAAGMIDRSIRFADDVLGRTSKSLQAEANTLIRAKALGRTAKSVSAEAAAAAARTSKARVQAGIGASALAAGGFLGIHKYHQHKDDAILAKIDQMYANKQKGK